MKKRILSILLIIVLLMTSVPLCAVPVSAAGYSATAATDYAKKYWNNGVGLCAEFVSNCLAAGGCNAWDVFVVNLRNELAYGGWGIEYVLTRSGGYVYQNKNAGKIAAGDPILFWCKKCKNWVHAAICGGVDSRGIVRAYGHNAAWNAIDNFATYRHGESNNMHTGDDIIIYSVRMNGAKESFSNTNPDNYKVPNRSLENSTPNMVGGDVCWVQTALKKLGYSIGIDGVYGTNTEKVVKQFQTDYNLTVDGVCGSKTVGKLQSLLKCAHSYSPATCTKPKICKICGETSGSALGHNYKKATCTVPKTCIRCKKTSGSKLGHTYTNACDIDCNTCNNVRKAPHNYKKVITKANLTKNGKVTNACSGCGCISSISTLYRIGSVKLSETKYTYNGSVKTPSVTVKDTAGKVLKKGTDYTVTYATGRKYVGTYKVDVKMKGNYSGTKTMYFKINPVKTTVSKLTAGKKSITVAITKKSSQITGYQIQFSTSKKFTNAKINTISSYKTTKTTLKSLSAKKTYYVRVRTYKTVGKTKYYSGWSTYKYVKTK